MTGNWRRAAAGLAILAALTWAFARRAEAPLPVPLPPTPAPAPVDAMPASPAAAPKTKPAARPKPAVAPVPPPETRGAGLRDPGEALGGTPPERGKKTGSK